MASPIVVYVFGVPVPSTVTGFGADMPQKHVCALCGAHGHNVRGCSLSGAQKFRKMLANEKKAMGCLSKQAGRQKPRVSAESFGQLRTARSKEYTGARRKKPAARPRLKSSKPVPVNASEPLFESQLRVMQRKWDETCAKGLLRLPDT